MNVKFKEMKEMIINHGAIGARNDANPGVMKAIMLVEQHTTPLARADAPAIAVDVDDMADVLFVVVSNQSRMTVPILSCSQGIGIRFRLMFPIRVHLQQIE